jgi:tRNA(Ile)-lysidine synthase
MMNLVAEARQMIRRHAMIRTGATVVVGVSGGPDSLCLLHVLRQLAPELALDLHVAHLNHGLRGAEADDDARFVEQIAAGWGLPATIETVNVGELAQLSAMGLEEAARHARYTFLVGLARRLGAGVIAVGHTADDQAETVVMHFLRGSGLAGLRGMLPISDLGHWSPRDELGQQAGRIALVRPLLYTTRAEVVVYCDQNDLTPRLDRSNENITFFRNRLRYELLPLLETYNPHIRRILSSTAAVVADDYQQLRGQLSTTWETVVTSETEEMVVVDLMHFRALPASLQRGLLREATYRLRSSLRDVGFIHVENALWLAREGHAGDRMTLPAGLELVLDTDRLAVGSTGCTLPIGDVPQLAVAHLLPVPGLLDLAGWVVETEMLQPESLPNGWQSNPDPWQAWLDAGFLGSRPRLRTRVEGERFRPQGLGGHSKPVAEFFTNAKVPIAARSRWPLLATTDDQIAWVCGWRVDERAKVTPTTRRVLHVHFRKQAQS